MTREAPSRSLLRFITCGSVDDGKSTLLGRLLFDAGMLPDDQIEALQRDSRRLHPEGDVLDFSLLTDGLDAERQQGITIDVAYRYFHSARRSFIVADCPGHEQYTRNMATGASQADVAIVLVDARKGLLTQTRRHTYICALLGIRKIILAVNKMDLVGYQQETYEAIRSAYAELSSGFGLAAVQALPVCALEGDNVGKPSSRMAWYEGPALLDMLETIEVEPVQSSGFRMPVQWVNRPDQSFRGYAGTCFPVQAFRVPAFALIQWRIHEYLHKFALLEQAARKFALALERRDDAYQDNQPRIDHQVRHFGHTSHVFDARLWCKAQIAIETMPQIIAIEQIGVIPQSAQAALQKVGDRRLASTGQPGEPKTLRLLAFTLRARLLVYVQMLPVHIGGAT